MNTKQWEKLFNSKWGNFYMRVRKMTDQEKLEGLAFAHGYLSGITQGLDQFTRNFTVNPR